ncbi:MAG: VWA domain-containing protein [Acidobacteria bacterium]|nr:VWA domain-containing protein [Acidobacteriota bacterium]
MKFLTPELAWWMAAGIAVAALLRWLLRRRQFAASTSVRWLGGAAYRASALRRLPMAVLLAAVALIAGALMQPVLPYSEAEVSSRGVDIVVVLDLSSSMQEEMDLKSVEQRVRNPSMPPGETRLDATKAAIKRFVRGRREDRIGLVVFSDNAYVVSPLTFDHDYLVQYVDMVDEQILQGEGQTAIGEGLSLANYLLSTMARPSGGQQVIVLFTDGENNRGRDPVEALGDSRAANIRVHMVGVSLDPEIEQRTEVRRLMQAIVKDGGKYYNATSSRDLDAASRLVDSVEKSVLVSRVYVRNAPVYGWFALPALLCLAGAVALRAVPYFVDHT